MRARNVDSYFAHDDEDVEFWWITDYDICDDIYYGFQRGTVVNSRPWWMTFSSRKVTR